MTSLMTRLFKRSEPTSPATVSDPVVGGFFSMYGASDSGVHVTPDLALTASSVWACVSVISSAVSTLDVHVADREDGTHDLKHNVATLLQNPNEFMTGVVFLEVQMVNLLLWGNSYAYIERGPDASPIGLYPLRSAFTTPRRINGQLSYLCVVGGETFNLRPDQVLHVPGMSFDGIAGLSPIQYARQSMGLSLSLEKFASKFFGSGGNLGGIIEMPPMKPEAVAAFKAAWTREYTGIENAHRVAVLPDGMKFHSISTTPEAAQAVEARQFQVVEIARIYRVPAHKIGDLSRSTMSNIEWQSLEFRSDTILPITTKYQAELTRKLLREDELATLKVQFSTDVLLQTDTKTRYDAWGVALSGGWMTTNEVRAKEHLPPLPGGDVLMKPLNFGPANGQPNNPPNPPSPPAPGGQAQRSDQTRRLLESTTRRIVTKESKAVARAAKKYADKPVEFDAWASQFFEDHRDHVADVLNSFDISDLLSLAADHCRSAHEETIIAFKAGAVDALLERWERERPAAITNQILGS